MGVSSRRSNTNKHHGDKNKKKRPVPQESSSEKQEARMSSSPFPGTTKETNNPFPGHRDSAAPTRTQNSIFGHMAARQTSFEESLFFRFLEKTPTSDWIQKFLPRLGFWVMAFQDVLRMTEGHVKDPAMKVIEAHIRDDDKGHDNWFVRDMASLGLAQKDLLATFSEEDYCVREATYAIMSEVYRATDDRLIIVLLLSLESASYVFFGTMVTYLENSKFPKRLHYLGRTHYEAELSHGIVEAKMDDEVEEAVRRSPEVHAQALAMIDRVYDAFIRMFDRLLPEEAKALGINPS